MPFRNTLQHSDLGATLGLGMGETVADRARRRVREEMDRQHLNQSDIAGRLGWTQTRVSKILNGKIELGVDDLGALCFALGLSLTEAVRDHGLEFCAEMQPTELRMLERFRQLTPRQRDNWLGLFEVVGPHTRLEERRAMPKKPLLTKGRGVTS